MDLQSAFNIALSMVGALGGWWMRVLWETQTKLREDLAALERGLPQTYARRDDMRDLTKAIFERFDTVEAKIDRLHERDVRP